MRIFWQSFVDQATSAPYMARLAAYLNEIAAPGTSVHVEGITPADRDFGRLSEFRCAIQAVDNGFAAQESGFDAYVMGHFQDPGLYELRSALTIPVVGTGEATLLAALPSRPPVAVTSASYRILSGCSMSCPQALFGLSATVARKSWRARSLANAKLGPRLGSVPLRRRNCTHISALFSATAAQFTTGA